MTHATVTIQITSESKPSTPSWMGEVAAFAQILEHTGTLKVVQNQVRFARARFGHYDLIDFVAVLIGYILSGEPTLLAFYERLAPFAEPFMALFGRNRLPHRSTLSRFLAALDPASVEGLRSLCAKGLACAEAVSFCWWPVRPTRCRVSGDRCRWDPTSCPSTCAAADRSLACSPSAVWSGVRSGLSRPQAGGSSPHAYSHSSGAYASASRYVWRTWQRGLPRGAATSDQGDHELCDTA